MTVAFLQIHLKSGSINHSVLFFSRIILTILGSLSFHINLRISLSISGVGGGERPAGILNRDYVESVAQSGEFLTFS